MGKALYIQSLRVISLVVLKLWDNIISEKGALREKNIGSRVKCLVANDVDFDDEYIFQVSS
jgi:hypothetical protein